jgi:long-chain acyl-CoA synthetase
VSEELRTVVSGCRWGEVNRELSRPEQIKRIVVLTRDFSEEQGEVAPPMKLKRRICEQHLAAEIEQLCDGSY